MHAYQIWNFHFEDYSDYYSAIRLFWVNIVKSYTTKITYLFWNSHQRASNEELSCEPKQSIKQIVDLPVIWMLCHSQDIALMGRLLHNLNLVPGRRTVTDWVEYEAQPEFIGLTIKWLDSLNVLADMFWWEFLLFLKGNWQSLAQH